MKINVPIRVLHLVLVIIMASLFTTCSKKEPIESIVGKWHNEETNESWEFSNDGSFVLYDGEEAMMSGTYEIINEGAIRLHHESLTTVQGYVKAAISGNRLNLTASYIGDGVSAWYTRVR